MAIERTVRAAIRSGDPQRLLELAARERRGRTPEDPAWPLLDLCEAHGHRFAGDLKKAERLLWPLVRRADVPALQVRAASALCWVLRQQRRLDEAIAVLQAVDQEALDGEQDERASWAHQFASCLLFAGRADEAELAAKMGLHGAQPDSRAHLLEVLGRIHRYRGDWAAARERLEEASQIWRRLGGQEPLGNALMSLGDVARQSGDLEAAEIHYEASLHVYRGIAEDHAELGPPAFNLALLRLEQGRSEDARTLLLEGLDRFSAHGRGVWTSACHLALCQLTDGEAHQAHAEAALHGLRGYGFYAPDLLALAHAAATREAASRELWTLVLEQAMGLGDDEKADEARGRELVQLS